MMVLVLLTFAFKAESKKSAIRKPDFSKLKNATVTNNLNPGQFKNLFVTANQISVPGYSEDYSWNRNLTDWMHDSNTTYTYDNAGRLLEEIAQESVTGIYFSRNTCSYDIHGNITEEVSYTWGNNEWVPVAGDKLVYTISAESQINGYIEQTIKEGVWVNKTRVEYILNTFNIPIGMLTYHWNGTDWMLYSKTMNITWADWQSRQLAAYTIMLWQNETWVNSERYTTEIDENHHISTTEFWVNVEWVTSTRETYSRTEFNEEIVIENRTESGWEIEKYRGTFDGNGNPTGMFYSTWYENEWFTEMELFFDLTFNQSNDVTEMVFRYRDPGLSIPMNIAKYKYSNFLHFTTDVPEVSVLDNVKIFPNPVSNSLNINIDEPGFNQYQVEILNLAGQVIFSESFPNPQILINTESFTGGMYLLKIKTENGKTFTSKLLKN